MVLFTALLSMHMYHDPTYLGTINVGMAHGLVLKPFDPWLTFAAPLMDASNRLVFWGALILG